MEKKLLHTPEGVRDLYGAECANKLMIQNKMHQVLKSYGYRDIQTPSFEFFDIFNKERGSVASKNMFKFFDREGNTLVMRPDITPSIARCAAKYFENDNDAIRLCYLGNTFINKSSYQGRMKETTQLGCELIEESGAYADAEMIAMMVEALLCAGLKDFQVEIGNVAYFKGIVSAAGIDKETEEELRSLILEKNFFGVEELAKNSGLSDKLIKALFMLPQMFGQIDKLEEAKSYVDNEVSLNAIDHLFAVYDLVKAFGYEKYISFDLGMLSELTYYTGIMFKAVTYDVGEPVAAGGRYDELIGQFGKSAPSIGFSITVDLVLLALNRQKIAIDSMSDPVLIVYNENNAKAAIEVSKKYRSNNTASAMVKYDATLGKEYYENMKNTKKFSDVVFCD